MRRWLGAITLVLLAAGAAGADDDDPALELARKMERAHSAYRDGYYAEALGVARALVTEAPAAPELRLLHGGIAEYIGEFDEARDAYGWARLLAPSSTTAQYRMGSLLARLGEYDQALTHLDWVVTAQPWETRWKFLHGSADQKREAIRGSRVLEHLGQLKIDILMEKGDLAEARRLAAEFGFVEPDRNYCAEARANTSRGRAEALFTAYRLATLTTPTDADCIWWYGQWLTDEGYMRLGRLMVMEGTRLTSHAGHKASGERYLRVRLGGGREVAKRAEQLAMIARQRHLRDRDSAGAVRMLEEAIRLEPPFVRPYLHMARIATDQGDTTLALDWLLRAVKVDPDSWRARRNLGRLLADLGRWADAEAQLTKTVELFADDAGGRLALARVLFAQGKYGDYVRETRAALGFARAFQHALPDVQDFLAAYEQSGAPKALPPAPDPRLLIGWNYD